MKTKFKKFIAFLIMLTMVLSGAPLSAYAKDNGSSKRDENGIVTDGDYQIQTGKYSDTEVSGVIVKYTGNKREIKIPKKVGGHKVKGIGDEVFKGKDLTKLIIPSGVEYIGKSAFENNKIREFFVPDSVKTVDDGAFKAVNKTTSETFIKGMRGVTSLNDEAFGKMFKLVMDIPSVKSVNKSAFDPEPNSPYQSPYYVRLFTKNKNKYNLKSENHLYLIDPAKILCRSVDSETGTVLRKPNEYPGSIGAPKYDRNTDMSKFYKIGDTSAEHGILNEISGYLRPLEKRTIQIKDTETLLDFEYKPVSAEIEMETTVDNQGSYGQINGKILAGGHGLKDAEVVIEKEKRRREWESVGKKIVAGDGGEFQVDYTDDDIKVGDKLRFKVSYKSNEYSGKANDLYMIVKEGITPYPVKVKPLKEIVVKAGEGFIEPQKAKIEFSDGTTKEYNIDWDQSSSDKIDKNKAGEYWMRGTVDCSADGKLISDYINKFNVGLQITIEENEEIHETDKDNLSREIDSAKENYRTSIVSVNGSDIDPKSHWVTQSVKDDFWKDITVAVKVNEDSKATQDEVDDALTALKKAVEKFNGAKKPGTKVNISQDHVIYKMLVTADNLNESNMNDFKVALKNNVSGKTKNWKTVKNEAVAGFPTIMYAYTFELEKGTWEVQAPKGYIVTNNDGNARHDNPIVTVTKGGVEIKSDFRFIKGAKVTYEVGEHGTTKDPTESYYIPKEHWSEIAAPEVNPVKGWVFQGWSVDGNTVIKKDFDITEDTKLKAVYKEDNGSVNENTEVGGGWVVGDFEYAKEENEPSLKGQWKVVGFSKTGADKALKHYNLYLPHVTPNGEEVTIVGEPYKDGEPQIMKGSFANKDIESVNFPDTITDIYGWAFQGNPIKKVTFHEGLKFIGNWAFWQCNLEEVTLPNSLESIGNGAFEQNKLKEIHVPGKVKEISTTTFKDNKIEKVILESGLEKICKEAFQNNYIKKLKLPLSVKSVHGEAFADNDGLTNYGGKVGLIIGNGKENPNNIKDSNWHKVNPELNSGGEENNKKTLHEYLLAIENNNNATFTSMDGKDVPKDEKWLRPELKAKMKAALYAGYYAYYDDTSNASGENADPKYTVAQAIKLLKDAGVEAKNTVKYGTKSKLSKETIDLKVGIPGIEYKTDLKPHHQDTYVLRDKNNDKSRAYFYDSVLEAIPNLAFLKYKLPKGNYELLAPVGMVYTHQQGINGETVPDDNTDVDVPKTSTMQMGYSAQEGCVLVYDLGDEGESDDLLYETVMKGKGARKIPRIKTSDGYVFKCWSLDGKTAVDIVNMKTGGHRIVKALYEKGTKIENLNVTLDSTNIKEGQSCMAKATITPEKATNKTVTWISDNPKIASIDSKGRITANKAGKVHIIGRTVDGSGLEDKVELTVTEDTSATQKVKVKFDLKGGKINDDFSSVNIEVKKGASLGEKMITNPARNGYDFVGWDSDGDGKADFTKDTNVNDNITVMALWTKKTGPEPKPTPDEPKPNPDEPKPNPDEPKPNPDQPKTTPNKQSLISKMVKAKLKHDLSVDMKKVSFNTKARFKKRTMKMSWKKSKLATYYIVAYRKAGAKKWRYKKVGKNPTFTFKKMKVNGLMQFKIKAVKKIGGVNIESFWSKTGFRYYNFTKIKKFKIGHGNLVLSIQKLKKSGGYRVLYSVLNKNWKKSVKYRWTNRWDKTRLKIKNLKKGKKYVLSVAPVKKYKGKIYIGINTTVKLNKKIR